MFNARPNTVYGVVTMKKVSLRNVQTSETGNQLERTLERHAVTEERKQVERFRREDSKHLEQDVGEMI